MARTHVNFSDALLAQIDELCARTLTPRSKFIQRAVQLAIDDARMVFGTEAANEPQEAPQAPAEPLGGFVAADAFQGQQIPPLPADAIVAHGDEIAVILRGPVAWFELHATLKHLGVSMEQLTQEIDPDDDILKYQGKSWIDERGLGEARALCTDHEVSDKFWSWAQTMMIPSTN